MLDDLVNLDITVVLPASTLMHCRASMVRWAAHKVAEARKRHVHADDGTNSYRFVPRLQVAASIIGLCTKCGSSMSSR
jgi:hypothetical protein